LDDRWKTCSVLPLDPGRRSTWSTRDGAPGGSKAGTCLADESEGAGQTLQSLGARLIHTAFEVLKGARAECTARRELFLGQVSCEPKLPK
jgi:hypothetical protein